jgi:sugar phosphate permease
VAGVNRPGEHSSTGPTASGAYAAPATTLPFDPNSPGTPDRWRALALVAVCYFVFYLHRSLVSYVQPPLKAELGLTDTQLGWLSTGFLMPYALAQVFVGYLGDRFSRRGVLLGSLLGSSLALAGMGMVGSFTGLMAMLLAMAIAQSATVPAMASVIGDSFSPRTRATAVGIYLASYNLSLIVGGRFGGRIADQAIWTLPEWLAGPSATVAGWRMAMLVFAAVGLAAWSAFWLLFREPPRGERVVGAGLGMQGGGLARTLRAVLAVPTYWAIAAVFVLTAVVILAVQYWLPRYIHDRFQVNLEQAGWQATVWVQFATITGLLLGGWLGDRWSRRLIAGRTLLQMIGVFLVGPALLGIGLGPSLAAIALPMALYGLGIGFYQANLWAATFEVVDPAARATSIGLLNVSIGLTASWINPIVGKLQEGLGGLGPIFAWMSVLIVLALAVMLFNITRLLPRDYQGPLRAQPLA